MCLLGLFIIYWVDKFLILRRMVCDHSISYKLSRSMIKLIHLGTLYFAFGNVIVSLFPVYDETQNKYF